MNKTNSIETKCSGKKQTLLRDWAQIEASAPGRFVLIGDYGDMDDRNAIAVALDRRLKVTIRPHESEGKLRLNLKDLNDVREWSTDLPVFIMTKLVAHQSDVLTYTKFMSRRLKPLISPKYRIATKSNATSHNASDKKNYTMEASQLTKYCHPKPLASSSASSTTVKSAPGTAVYFRSADDDNILLHGDSYAKSIRPSLDIEVESDIPMCRGLGSSTAYGAALCAALMKVFLISAEPAFVTDWAVNIDKFFHNEASALHSSSVIEGGYIYFQDGKLKSVGIPHTSPVKIMLIDTGIRRNPRYMNSKVKEKLAEGHEAINGMIAGTLNDLASAVWRRINDSHFEPSVIHGSLNVAQETLLMLGLSDRKILELCSLASQHRLSCKQSQAGETVFLLYDDISLDLKTFRHKVTELGYTFEDHDMSLEGVKLSVVRRAQEELDRMYEELNMQTKRSDHSSEAIGLYECK